jgi:hypothetical protein
VWVLVSCLKSWPGIDPERGVDGHRLGLRGAGLAHVPCRLALGGEKARRNATLPDVTCGNPKLRIEGVSDFFTLHGAPNQISLKDRNLHIENIELLK